MPNKKNKNSPLKRQCKLIHTRKHYGNKQAETAVTFRKNKKLIYSTSSIIRSSRDSISSKPERISKKTA